MFYATGFFGLLANSRAQSGLESIGKTVAAAYTRIKLSGQINTYARNLLSLRSDYEITLYSNLRPRSPEVVNPAIVSLRAGKTRSPGLVKDFFKQQLPTYQVQSSGDSLHFLFKLHNRGRCRVCHSREENTLGILDVSTPKSGASAGSLALAGFWLVLGIGTTVALWSRQKKVQLSNRTTSPLPETQTIESIILFRLEPHSKENAPSPVEKFKIPHLAVPAQTIMLDNHPFSGRENAITGLILKPTLGQKKEILEYLYAQTKPGSGSCKGAVIEKKITTGFGSSLLSSLTEEFRLLEVLSRKTPANHLMVHNDLAPFFAGGVKILKKGRIKAKKEEIALVLY